MIVAADGSGDFKSVQEAVDAVSPDNSERVNIYIKNGIYQEKLHIEKKWISLIGENADQTIITYDDYAMKTYLNGEPYYTFNSYSVFIGGDDFIAEHISFVNSAGKGEVVGQALAAYIDGDRVSFRSCRFLGHQDTIFTGPLPEIPVDRTTFGGPREGAPRRNVRQYFENCYIEGDVDFIFGSATAVFNGCEIFAKNRLTEENSAPAVQNETVNGWLVAASTPENARYGYVFIECRLTSDAPDKTVYLGRPWRNHAKVAFLYCWMGEHIKSEGWDNWGKHSSEETTFFSEYKNSGPGALTSERVSWSHVLTDQEAEAYTIKHILAGLDEWIPLLGEAIYR